MTLADCLAPESIRVPPEVRTLEEALSSLLETLLGPDADVSLRAKRARDLAFGSQGEVVRLHDDVVLVLDVQEGVAQPRAGLAITDTPFVVTGEGPGDDGRAMAVFLFLLPGKLSAFRGHAAATLGRWVREADHAEGLVAARTPAEVFDLEGLGRLVLSDRLRVDAAMSPVTYRVYPETPAAEVLDLMVRRSLPAVPVVGEGYEVLGVITAGDALRHLLPRHRAGEGDPPLDLEGRTARDVMTRSVLCVSEDQALTDAAAMMVNRDVEEIPVVREGELVGLLTREAVLRALHGS
jgi:CBS domain-containing protein